LQLGDPAFEPLGKLATAVEVGVALFRRTFEERAERGRRIPINSSVVNISLTKRS
jgi:hypothetical protein